MEISAIADQIKGCNSMPESDVKARWRMAMKQKPKSVSELKAMLDGVIGAVSLLLQIRRFNHVMIEELGKSFQIVGCALLDVGASVWGFALEAALEAGVTLYEGATLGVRSWKTPLVQISGPDGQVGRL